MVDEHRELADDHSTTQGSGWFYIDAENRIIWLYGRSMLFGSVPKNVLRQVIATGNHDYPGFKWYFSRSSKLVYAMKMGELLG